MKKIIRILSGAMLLLIVAMMCASPADAQTRKKSTTRSKARTTQTAKKFSAKYLPEISAMRPLLVKHLKDWQDIPIMQSEETIYYEKSELINEIKYPVELPKFTAKGLEFIWDLYELGPQSSASFSSLIPYEELLPIASPELIQFFPAKYRTK